MIVLDTQSRSLEIILAGAKTTADCSACACWTDNLGRRAINASVTNGTTAVVLCAGPLLPDQIIAVDEITVVNEDSADVAVTIRVTDSANAPSTAISRTLCKVTLDSGDNLSYSAGSGWCVLTGAGELKNSA